MRISTGCNPIDNLLEGGIESGTITCLYGGGGTGKTNLSLQLTVSLALKGKKVIYVDTEGVSAERLKQISGDKSDEVMKNTLFFRAHSFEEKKESLDKAEKLVFSDNMDIGLVIVDSFTIFYRTLISDSEERNISKRLGRQMIKLLRMARKKDIPVVITTQVYHSQQEDTDKPLGGHILYHNSKTLIKLENVGPHIRKSTLIKHRSAAEKGSVRFKITREGLRAVD